MLSYKAPIASLLLAQYAAAQAGPYSLTASDTTLVYTVTQQTGGDIPLGESNLAASADVLRLRYGSGEEIHLAKSPVPS